jgi:hypothetical protein
MNAPFQPNRAHAVYAPSSADRWRYCTASATAIAHLPEQEEGQEAKEGTEAHEEIDRCLGPLCETRGQDGMLPFPVDPEHPAAYGVALVINYVSQLPPGKLWVEQRVRLTDEIWGRCDVAHWHAESQTLTIVDYKNGFVPVDVEDSGQLQIYAAATIYTRNLPAKWIRLVVVQPNDFRPVPRVKQHVMSADALFAFATEMAAIPGGPLTFVAGEHCRYCPLFGLCEPTRDLLGRLAVLLQHKPDQVRPEQVKSILALQKPIEDWFKGFNTAKTREALSGVAMPGMRVVEGVTKRAWKAGVEDTVRQAIIATHGVGALDLPTPAQAEKLGVDVSLYATKPQGAPVLAYEDDRRPTFAPKSAAEMFKGVVR